jgi:uridine kinase
MISPFVLGLAGGSASGKTTAAVAVAELLGPEHCAVLSHDLYYLPPPPDLDPVHHNFDEPAALETALLVEHLDALRAGRPADVPRYDFTRHRRQPGFRFEPRPVILVEGILILADEDLRARFDRTVFFDTPEHVRLHRRLDRDQSERGRSVGTILEQYFCTVRPMYELHVAPGRDRADLVLDGSRPLEDLRSAILQLLP